MATAAPTTIHDISIAHSPDSDDAFMFYGLATNKVRVPGYRFNHTLTDIEQLNHKAINEAFFDVTAISFHAYPYLQDKLRPDALRRQRRRGLRPHGRQSPRRITDPTSSSAPASPSPASSPPPF